MIESFEQSLQSVDAPEHHNNALNIATIGVASIFPASAAALALGTALGVPIDPLLCNLVAISAFSGAVAGGEYRVPGGTRGTQKGMLSRAAGVGAAAAAGIIGSIGVLHGTGLLQHLVNPAALATAATAGFAGVVTAVSVAYVTSRIEQGQRVRDARAIIFPETKDSDNLKVVCTAFRNDVIAICGEDGWLVNDGTGRGTVAMTDKRFGVFEAGLADRGRELVKIEPVRNHGADREPAYVMTRRVGGRLADRPADVPGGATFPAVLVFSAQGELLRTASERNLDSLIGLSIRDRTVSEQFCEDLLAGGLIVHEISNGRLMVHALGGSYNANDVTRDRLTCEARGLPFIWMNEGPDDAAYANISVRRTVGESLVPYDFSEADAIQTWDDGQADRAINLVSVTEEPMPEAAFAV